jgi:predicted nucleic acid-binding Zn ribbon protein
MINNRCVCCGEIIPEGRMVCPQCEYDNTYHCIVCDAKIPKPEFIFGGRGNGKTTMIFNHNVRQMCCSDECFDKLVDEIRSEMNGI